MDKHPNASSGILTRFIEFILAFFGWSRPEVVGIEIIDGKASMVEESILREDLLAYANVDDPAIYVNKNYVERVAEELGANVDGNIWQLKEDGVPVERERKDLQVQNFYNQVASVKWTYLKGFKCERHPAGFWLNIYRRRSGRFYRSYKTTEAGSWCIHRRRGSCKLVLIEVEGDYWSRPHGTWKEKN